MLFLPLVLAAPNVCVTPEDKEVIVQVLKEARCLRNIKPVFKLDPITLVEDNDGRLYVSGNPYKLHMTWCHYTVDATGKLPVTVAHKPPESSWGLSWKVKALGGVLVGKSVSRGISEGLDAGLAIEAFHVQEFNLNGYVGIRSVGGGLGVDLTKNFGTFVGGAIRWGDFSHDLTLGAYFVF